MQVAAILAVTSLHDLKTLREKGAIPSSKVSETTAGLLILRVIDARLNAYPSLSRGRDLQLIRQHTLLQQNGPVGMTPNGVHAVRVRMAERELLLQLRREVETSFKLTPQVLTYFSMRWK